MIKRCWLKIYGTVQGVGFRFSAQKKARQLAIVGLARNEPDGSVYIEAQGEATVLDDFIQWCSHGPRWAKVREINYGFFEKPSNNKDFLIY
jgi:acylphosphatase